MLAGREVVEIRQRVKSVSVCFMFVLMLCLGWFALQCVRVSPGTRGAALTWAGVYSKGKKAEEKRCARGFLGSHGRGPREILSRKNGAKIWA